MSWQDTLNKVTKLVAKEVETGSRDGKLFNEKIILEILNNKRIIAAVRKWLEEKSKEDRDISPKDLQTAEYFRQEGNRYYVQGVNAKALELYNDSIRFYPVLCSKNGQAVNNGVSLAYANRSAIFFNWKQYKKCLADIKTAFEFEYPDNLKYKLFKRKAECLIELGEFKEAKTALSSAKKILIDTQVKIKGRDKIIASIDEIWLKMQDSDPNEKMSAESDKAELVTVAYGHNKQLSEASDGIKLSHNASVGRHLLAEKNFKQGDALIVEKPFASAVVQKLFKSHCRHCLQKAENIIPCTNCSTQTYCSEKCRDSSWQQKHYFECGHLVRLHEIGIASMALHIVLRTNARIMLKEHANALRRDDNSAATFGLNNERICSDYRVIYSLTTHTKDMQFYDLIEYAITAVVLLLILKQGKFFERPDIIQLKEIAEMDYGQLCQDSLSKELKVRKSQDSINFVELLYGSLMFKHIQQIVCNGIAVTGIYDVQQSASKIVTYEQMRLGSAIYPTVSLINHSCDPNCIQTFQGNTVVIKATKAIRPGQELTISYGPIFSKQNWEERQRTLKDQYFFTCHCDRCKDGPSDEIDLCAFKCQHCEGPLSDLSTGLCPSCKKSFDEKWYREEHLKVNIPLQKFFPPSIPGINELKKILKIEEKIFYKYNRSISATHNAIACSYAQLEKYPKAKHHFEKALEIEKFIHGEESVEVGHNLETYSELLMECLQMNMARCSMLQQAPNFDEVRQCLSIVQKAIKILSITSASFGDSDELGELKQREKYLLEILRNERC